MLHLLVESTYRLEGNKLTLQAGPEPGNYGCNVRVEVSDPAPADTFTVNAERQFYFQCHRFQWEQACYDKLDECYEWANDVWRTRSWRIHIDPGYKALYAVLQPPQTNHPQKNGSAPKSHTGRRGAIWTDLGFPPSRIFKRSFA